MSSGRMSAVVPEYDVTVIGAGPSGSVLSAYLARAGLKVLCLERHGFPRYHIGESLTGISGDFIRDLGLDSHMVKFQFPPKTGVKVIGRDARSEFFVPVLRETWQVRRAEFDKLLLDHATASGADFREGSVKEVLHSGGKVLGIGYRPEGQKTDVPSRIRSRFVADASGHTAVLSQHRIAGPRRVDAFGRQIAVFSQYLGVVRDPGPMGDNTFIFYSDTNHWAWFIPLSPELVSIGVVLPAATFKKHGETPEEILTWGLENINPDLSRRMLNSEQIEPVRIIRNYSYRITPFAGDGWLCVGDAHRFSDPIFSFGVAMAFVEAKAASAAIVKAIETGDWTAPFAEYVDFSNRGQDVVYDFIRYFWKFPAFFGVQTRGTFRQDMIRLLAGDVFDLEPMPAIKMMRESLATTPVDGIPEGPPQLIAQRIVQRYSDFQGIAGSYLEMLDGIVRLTFVLEDDGTDLFTALYEFEGQLCEEFGQDRLWVVKRVDPPDAHGPVEVPEGAHLIFSRRRG